MPRPRNKSDQRRPLATAQCQPLEPRRLLAVIFDPTFGGGDGFTLMPSPFVVDPDSLGELENPFAPKFVSRLSGGYFTKGVHLTPDPLGATFRTFHALVEEDGTISTDLGRDSDEDGFVFYPQDSSGEFPFGVGDYSDYFPLDDGSGLALLDEPTETAIDDRVVRVLPNGRESAFFKIDGLGEIHAIERLSSNLGVLLASNEVPGSIPPFDLSELVYTVHLFDLVSGETLDDAQPFGDWLRLNRLTGEPTLHVGQDDKIYVGSLSADLDGADGNPNDSGFVLTRMELLGGEIRHDSSFGATAQLPGQKTRAAYFLSNLPADQNANSFLLAGTTDQGRAWVKMPDPQSGQNTTAFALLTSSGALDSSFGTDGVVEVDFPSADPSFANPADQSPGFVAARGGVTGAPAPFVRADGSLVGVVTLTSGAALPAGTEFGVGLYGLLPDGSPDTRIAEDGSSLGAGRTLIATDIDGDPDTATDPNIAAVFLDEAERLVLSAGTISDEPGATASLMVSRLLLGTPRTEVVERPNGDQVLEIEGTTGDDRFILRAGAGGTLELLQHPVGALQSVIGEFSSDGLDLIELLGGEGDDVLFSQVNAFAGLITVFGGNGNDTLSANGRFDRIFGEVGSDSLLGGLGDQLIFGGDGNDTLRGGSGRDALFGEAGNDQLFGLSDDDLLEGGLGNDKLNGGDGADTLVSGAGADVLIGGNGERDLLWLRDDAGGADLGVGFSVDLTVGRAETAGVSDELASIEHVLGTDGDDDIRGNNARNAFYGGLGADTLLGMGGKDTLVGGFGSDRLDGGDDADLLLDTAELLGDASPDVLIGGGGFDRALLDAFDDREEVESVFESLEDLLEVL